MTSWRRLRAYLRSRPVVADSALAVSIFLVTVVGMGADKASLPPSIPIALAWNALALGTLVVRRQRTWLAVGLLAAHTVVALAVPRYLQVEGFGILVMTYTAAAHLAVRRAVLATVALWGPVLVAGLTVIDPGLPPTRLPRAVFALLTAL